MLLGLGGELVHWWLDERGMHIWLANEPLSVYVRVLNHVFREVEIIII